MSGGACTSCQIETYENFPWMKEETKEPKCTKESMTNCLYTSQGMFVCQKDVGVKNEVPNEEMARFASFAQKGVAKTAGSWASSQ